MKVKIEGLFLDRTTPIFISQLRTFFAFDNIFSVTSATLCDAIVASEKATFTTPFARLGKTKRCHGYIILKNRSEQLL